MSKRGRKEKRTAQDTWKSKIWYAILSPDAFGGKEIGKTPAFGDDYVSNRIFETTLFDLTSDFNHTHIILKFRFKELVESNTIKTMFVGCDFTRDYLRSLVRRTTSRIDSIFNVTTKDGYFLRIEAIVLTQRRAKTGQRKIVRQIMNEITTNAANSLSFSEFAYNSVYGNIAKEITEQSNKILPIRRSEIMKIKLLKMPTELSAAA